jgi:outer membrane protein OmpA-like peptidoglycan-associated protein
VPPTAPVNPTAVTPAAAPATLAPGGTARILFSAGNAEIPDDAKTRLDAIITQLTANERERLQLVAYANGTANEANQARRISLQRALEIRKYLMERGVPATRMDVRALGNRSEGKDPPDRVDIVTLDR